MKTVMQFLSLVLCFELVLGPVQGSILFSSVAYAEDCPPGQVWTSLGRCQISDQSMNVSNQVNACTTAECFTNNAKKAQTDKDTAEGTTSATDNDVLFKNDGSGEQKWGTKAANAAVIAIPLVIVTSVLLQKREAKDATEAVVGVEKNKATNTKKVKAKEAKAAKTKGRAGKDFSCNPPSLLLMYAAAAAMAVGEIYGYFNHKTKLKQIQAEWDKTVMPKNEDGTDKKRADASEAQSQAFEFLAQNEDQVAKTTKTKKGFYIAATGLFAAGAIAATVEQFQLVAARARLVASTDPAIKLAAQQKIAKLTCNSDKSLDKTEGSATDKNEKKEKKDIKDAKDEAEKKEAEEVTKKRDEEFKDYEKERKDLTQENAELIKDRDEKYATADGKAGDYKNPKEYRDAKTEEINANNEKIAALDKEQGSYLNNEKDENLKKMSELNSDGKPKYDDDQINQMKKHNADIDKKLETVDKNAKSSSKAVEAAKVTDAAKSNGTNKSSKDAAPSKTSEPDSKTWLAKEDKAAEAAAAYEKSKTPENLKLMNEAKADLDQYKKANGILPDVVVTGKAKEKTDSNTVLTDDQKKEQEKLPENRFKNKSNADLRASLFKAESESAARLAEVKIYDKKISDLTKKIESSIGFADAGQIPDSSAGDEIELQALEGDREKAYKLYQEAQETIKYLKKQLNIVNFLKQNSKSAIETFASIYKVNRLEIAALNGNKTLAIKNISGAKDTVDLLNLMNQLEDMETENVSHLSYVDNEMSTILSPFKINSQVAQAVAESLMNQEAEELAELTEDFNSVKLENYANHRQVGAKKPASSITDSIIPKAHAEGGMDKIMELGGKVLPLIGGAGGMKQIVGGLKLSGGAPLPASKLNEIHSKTNSWLIKAIGKPVTRIGINAVLGTWTGIMQHHMQKQQWLSEKRAAALRAMKEEFVTTNGIISCTEDDRLDPTKPRCFCYTAENKVNLDRSKQPACIQEVASLKFDSKDNVDKTKVCLDQNMNVDSACACRAKKSCMKITSGLSTSGFNIGSFKMISSGSAPAQDLFSGNVAGADIADSAGINAVNIRKAADDMLAKMDPKAVKEKNSFADGLQKGLLASAGGLSMGSLGGSSPLPSSPAGAAAALDKELKASKEDDAAQKAGSTYHGADFNNDSEPDPTAIATDEPGTEELEIAEVMDKEIDTGDSDINNASHTNIFDVLSNRYKRSGMRRLFEDGKSIPVDAPSKTEIAE